MPTYVKYHMKRVAISAGVAAVVWNFQLLEDTGLWQTWAMVGVTFLMLVVFMYLAISAFGLLGVTQAKSNTKVDAAAKLAASDGFNFDPTDPDWIRADHLYGEALEIEPTNTRAANGREYFVRQTLEAGAIRFNADLIDDLPIEYRQLSDSVTPGFLWITSADLLPLAIRPESWIWRVRRFVVSSIGGTEDTKPNWIVGLIAIFLILAVVVVEERSDVESTLAGRYRSVCESLLGDCGGKIDGFDRTDAYDAAKAVLENRYPVHNVNGRQLTQSSCWDLARDSIVAVDTREEDGYFVISFGYGVPVGRGPDRDVEHVESSRWIVTPPAVASEWTVSVGMEPDDLPDGYTCAG